MLTIIFLAALIWVAWKVFILGLKLTWGMTKIVFGVILLPLLLGFMIVIGLLYLAIPILIIAGIYVLIHSLISA